MTGSRGSDQLVDQAIDGRTGPREAGPGWRKQVTGVCLAGWLFPWLPAPLLTGCRSRRFLPREVPAVQSAGRDGNPDP